MLWRRLWLFTVLRPPVAQDALELTSDGKVLLRLRRPWRLPAEALA